MCLIGNDRVAHRNTSVLHDYNPSLSAITVKIHSWVRRYVASGSGVDSTRVDILRIDERSSNHRAFAICGSAFGYGHDHTSELDFARDQ